MSRVLVANDDSDLLEICRDVLEAAGHVVRAVSGGTAALDQALRWRPDAIVVDWRMPDMDGMAAVRALREHPETARIPILLMSASEGAAEQAAHAGADGFLSKPFSGDELVAGIDRIVALGVSTAHPS